MSESVSLPALGESVTEGTVTRWLKQVGDRVEVDEPLLEVSTDKVDTEIPSPVAGVVEQILVQEDETVEVGTALVMIGDGSAPAGAPAQPAAAEAPAAGETTPAEAEEAPAEAEEAPAQQEQAPEQPAAAPAPSSAPEPTPAEPAQASPDAEVPSTAAESPAQAPAPATAVDEAPASSAQSAPAASAPEPAPAASSAPAAQAPAAAAAPAASEPAPAAPSSGSHAGTGYVTPIVRKLANEQGVDLSTLTGTGVGGRIRKEDVLNAGTPATAPAEAAASTKLETSVLRGTVQPMSRLRKVVADRAVVSMQNSAQLTTVVEVDVTKVAALRAQVKGDFEKATGTKLSFLPFFTLAAAEALKAYPVINATVDGENIVYPDHEHISIAVDTERGLLTPVVRDASAQNIAQLSQQIADLAQRTRDNKLKPDELAGGTFTVTNTGSRGALFDTPLVFLPQVAILGTGIVTKKPVVVSADGADAIAVRSTVYLALSYDHRIVDGADAARFLVAVKNRLEEGAFERDLGI
ncbi:2-oxoglutarate dehydrogenase, E2 component, dihydrolipoamide succinyltransferase [Humibacter albus]|uniref:2-oxoglutarate dehydrogenase, E2 component, dihydrolipoamide succinyltransferase n=1 Tax=Humibacter albus TaxID=427754 RepID=UPI0003B5767F|nr:2-oxoglutarate dehydrogenase, E2 component, dihydrolipoamide succinyltransferase [Humibacter albus]